MNRAKYLFVIFIGTLVYVLLSISVGQNSISCYKAMEEQRRLVSKNASDIKSINTELQLEMTALKNDPAVIAAFARKLDYVAEDEKLIKITGLKPMQTTIYNTGSIVRHTEPTFVSEEFCKTVSVLAGLVFFFIFFIYDILHGNFGISGKKQSFVKGIPLYDVQQI